MPDTMYILSHELGIIVFHFKDGESEVQRCELNCPGHTESKLQL